MVALFDQEFGIAMRCFCSPAAAQRMIACSDWSIQKPMLW
jgi:hypothetical protein